MAQVSSWNVKVSKDVAWLHYKNMTRDEAIRKASDDHPGVDPETFSVFRSNVDDTAADWLRIYPDGNFPLGI